MATEDDKNIDDLVDYKDFESNLESNSDQDSFNKDIMKLYEDHKRKGGDKQTEVQNHQRPVSKYQRNIVSAGRREEEGTYRTNTENDGINNEFKHSQPENHVDKEQLKMNFINRFNNFISKMRLSQSEFMDNPKIYYTIEEFKEIFRKIRFDVSAPELNFLFSNNNSSSSDGYLLGQTFLDNFKYDIIWFGSDKEESKKADSDTVINPLYTEIFNQNSNVDSKRTDTEMKKINEEFKLLQNEVFQIVAKESRPKSSAKFPKRALVSGKQNISLQNNNKIQKTPSDTKLRPASNITYYNTQTRQNNHSKNAWVSKIKPQSASYLKETMMKKRAEEEMVRLAIERRNKENERDCIKKMSEANQIAESLGVMKSYSAYTDENEGVIICRVFDKVSKKSIDVDLKKFMLEYKKLMKLLKQRELTKYYKDHNTEETKNSTKESIKEENLLLLGRQQRQKKIKEVLIDSLELKMKLQKQLKALRDKNLVDPSIIRANLKLINLDDDNIL